MKYISLRINVYNIELKGIEKVYFYNYKIWYRDIW